MTAPATDSALYRGLFSDDETAAFFTDSAEIRAMLQVEGALARVQGDLGLIPETAAAFIERSAREVQIDPDSLATETATNGVPVPALIGAFRKVMEAPEHVQYLHWGATSQDIMDTGLALRLRHLTGLWEIRLEALSRALGRLARIHADLPMIGRTYGQVAVPTSFGAVVAGWGHPVLRYRSRLEALAPDLARVSLGGAAGTLSAMGDKGPAIRAGLARALGLTDPGYSWHAERDCIGAFAAWMAGLSSSIAKMGEDLILMTQSGIEEIRIAGAGGSSTMPQKQNPVGPSVLVALSRQATALAAALQGAAVHRQQRDGAAWFVEWLTLPQLCISTGRALTLALDLAHRISPMPAAMARGIDDGTGLIHAEALSFALAWRMPRPEAQAKVKALCNELQAEGGNLLALAVRDYPDLDLARVGALGAAPGEALAFAFVADPT